MKSITTSRQSGAVSLFVVIFAMLLMSVVTISFLRIMTNDQNQASGNDLAQSAYDSAEAGVEDAKRALIWYLQQCTGDDTSGCPSAKTNINSPDCNVAIRAANVANGWDSGKNEVKVQQSTQVEEGQSIDAALDQAYTCVTLQLDTDDFLANVGADQSVLIPLKGANTFNSVTIQWFSEDDLTTAGAKAAPDKTGTTPKPLQTRASWPLNRPPVLRAQFMQVGSSFKLTDFDSTQASGSGTTQSNANTLFLYPSTTGTSSTSFTGANTRANPSGELNPADKTNAPLPTRCVETIPSDGYACAVTLTLPNPVGASDEDGRLNATAYLRLTSFYVGSDISVTLNGTQFKEVQPIVDSTGRASDVFRRVQSRVDLYDTSTFPYPDGAVDVTGPFCKDFGVTDTNYLGGSCDPTEPN